MGSRPHALYRCSFELHLLLPLLNRSLGKKWYHKPRERKSLAWEVHLAVPIARRPPQPLQRVRVTVERHSLGEPDFDNLVGSAKLLFDILQPKHEKIRPSGLGFIVNDSPRFLERVDRHVRAKSKTDQKTVVTIEELP